MKTTLFVLAALLLLGAPPLFADGGSSGCSWWHCSTSALGAICDELLNEPQNPGPQEKYATSCTVVTRCFLGGACSEYCDYGSLCYTI